jgi:hypothetical protein
MTTATQNLVAVTPGGDITDEHIAGSYLWYSIPDEMIPLSRFRKAMRDAGLDVTRLPKERRGEHVAAEACKSVERVVTNGHREVVRSEQVVRTGDVLVMQITRHVQDKANRVIEHPKALRVIYDFTKGALIFEPLDGSKMADVQSLADEIQEHFDKNGTRVPGHKIRTILRHYVEAAGAENMRGQSGGVYFLAKRNPLAPGNKLREHHGEVIDGREFIGQIKGALTVIYGRAPEFHEIPCINDEGQREFLKRKFLENCADDLKEFRDQCVELVKSKDERQRGFRQDLRTRLVEQRKAMDLRRAKFADILGETLEELDRDMGLADKALAKFLTEADE